MSDLQRCSICGAHVQDRTTTYTQEVHGHIAVITEVPVLACVQCGEQYFSPETVDRLHELIALGAAGGPPQKTIEVPVYSFSAA